MTFTPVSVTPIYGGGVQKIYRFENGYGASVVHHAHSYGYPNKWELAVLDENGGLCDDTEITDDVIGWLDETDVDVILARIERL